MSEKHGHLCGSSAHLRESFDTPFKRAESFVFVVLCLTGIVSGEKKARVIKTEGIRAREKICLFLRNTFVDGVSVSDLGQCTESVLLRAFLSV